MNLPGFTAEASLGYAMGDYSSSAVATLFGRGVVASADQMETFNCGPCSELRGPDGKGSGVCTKWCCDAVSGKNCQFKDCACPPKRKGYGAIY